MHIYNGNYYKQINEKMIKSNHSNNTGNRNNNCNNNISKYDNNRTNSYKL